MDRRTKLAKDLLGSIRPDGIGEVETDIVHAFQADGYTLDEIYDALYALRAKGLIRFGKMVDGPSSLATPEGYRDSWIDWATFRLPKMHCPERVN